MLKETYYIRPGLKNLKENIHTVSWHIIGKVHVPWFKLKRSDTLMVRWNKYYKIVLNNFYYQYYNIIIKFRNYLDHFTCI
jgi:hypothetical protein